MLLHQDFIRTAKAAGEKTAIIDRSTGSRLTYGRTLVASLILAEKFEQGEAGFIGIMLPTSAGCILSILGALLSGRTPVMINYSTGAAQNCAFAQKKCDFKTIITSKALLDKINCPRMPGMIFIEDLLASVSAFDKIRAALQSKLPLPLLLNSVHGGADDDPAVVLFTSGSERDPKAVPLTHRNIAANLTGISAIIGLTADEIFLANLPLFHVFGLTVTMWLPLRYGMTIVSYANPLEFKSICEIIRDEKVTFVVGTPLFMWGYLRKSEPGDFASCRIMLTGADKTPDSLRQEFFQKHQLELLEGYGCTETSPVISSNVPGASRPGSVGKPLPNIQVRLEHYETGETSGVGEIGKILVMGDSIMTGYFDDFEATTLSTRRGWYDTGDMGYQDADGYLWHVGRLKRFVKIGGEMVSMIRVENVLERCLPEGVACCVVEVPDGVRGARIVAAVTQVVDQANILRQMSEELPNISLPKHFVVIEALPIMGTGKIDFRRTTELVREMVQHS